MANSQKEDKGMINRLESPYLNWILAIGIWSLVFGLWSLVFSTLMLGSRN